MLNFVPGERYYFPIRGDRDHEYYYDIWSNIHYGYVGSAAGFDPYTLHIGAQGGAAATGVNDTGDEITVQMGIDMWNKYGDTLTLKQVETELQFRLADLRANGKASPADDRK